MASNIGTADPECSTNIRLHDVLQAYAFPAVDSPANCLEVLKFRYALTIAHDGLMKAAKLDELLEEQQGEAAWIREEILGLGETLPVFDYAASCIVGSQFYLVKHLHPKVALGYFAALACAPIQGRGLIQRAATDGDRFPLLPMIELIAVHHPWLGGHILYNAKCTAASMAKVLTERLKKNIAPRIYS